MSDVQNNDRVKSTADKLRAAREAQELQNEKVIENMEDYIRALNGMAASPNGQHVLKIWIKALGVFSFKNGKDGVALIEDNAKRNFYLQFIRPHLEPATRQQIEG